MIDCVQAAGLCLSENDNIFLARCANDICLPEEDLDLHSHSPEISPAQSQGPAAKGAAMGQGGSNGQVGQPPDSRSE